MTSKTAKSKVVDKCQTCAIYSEAGGFCNHLTEAQHERLIHQSRYARLLRGDTISSQDLLVWPVIAIASGVLSLQHLLEDGRKTIAALFMPGDIVDMRGQANRHHGFLIALGKTEICRLSPTAFETVIDQNHDAQKVAWNSLRNQTFRAMDHVADLAKKQAIEKLASFLFECRRRQKGGKTGKRVHIPVRRIDLADYLGMQPETVSRCFKDMERRGTIAIDGLSDLKLLDIPTLRRIANGDKQSQNLRHTDKDHFNVVNSG